MSRFDPQVFWKPDTFPKVEEVDLTPDAIDDPLSKLADEVRRSIRIEVSNFLSRYGHVTR